MGERKLEQSREMALRTQEVEHWRMKAGEAGKEREGLVARYEEKLSKLRDDGRADAGGVPVA